MRTTVKIVIIVIPVVILASILFVYLISLSYVSTDEINEQVENLQTKYRQDFSEEIKKYPVYRVISEVLGEPSVKEMYRDYLEALNYKSVTEANNMYKKFEGYIETRAETKFKQEYPSEPFPDDFSELIFRKQ